MFALKNISLAFNKNIFQSIALVRGKHFLPDLPYDFGALEPVISKEIMEIHHQKHHYGYVNNLNVAEEQLADATSKGDLTKVIKLQRNIKFNGGGHINHSIFWHNLTPECTTPSKEFKEAVCDQFGCIEDFKNQLINLTVGIQGSGWGWLGYNKRTESLELATCANQDPLESTTGLIPLFGIDVWEHAYYLQYKNVRQSYVESIFQLANWLDISDRYSAATTKLKITVAS